MSRVTSRSGWSERIVAARGRLVNGTIYDDKRPTLSGHVITPHGLVAVWHGPAGMHRTNFSTHFEFVDPETGRYYSECEWHKTPRSRRSLAIRANRFARFLCDR